MSKAKPLTRAQLQTLHDVAQGDGRVSTSWTCHGARADVLGRLEERALIEVQWDAEPRGRVVPTYPVRLTQDGYRAREAAEYAA